MYSFYPFTAFLHVHHLIEKRFGHKMAILEREENSFAIESDPVYSLLNVFLLVHIVVDTAILYSTSLKVY